MQTFMPYSDFSKVAKCLDYRRLGKQRVEAWQIYLALTKPDYGWKNHPIVKMWRGYERALLCYCIEMIVEWVKRGYKDAMYQKVSNELLNSKEELYLPYWINDKELQLSHQSNLVRKDPKHYRQFFPDVPDNIPYKWVI